MAAATSVLRQSPKAATPAFSGIQRGIGRLVASADDGDLSSTRLTTISHQAPVRLIPLRSSAVAQAGAAACVLSNYGGGLLPGDSLKYSIQVKQNARLGVITQGSNNRIYQQRSDVQPQVCQLQSEFAIDQGGFLVVAPDPVTPFQNSLLQQEQIVRAHPESSVCVIDWFSSGRFANGERWEQQALRNRTKFYFCESKAPTLIDSVAFDRRIDNTWGMDWSQVQFNAYASSLMYGSPEVFQSVVDRCHELQEHLVASHTSIRRSPSYSESQAVTGVLSSLSGRVLVGVSRVPTPHSSDIYVARWAASSNEDLYRLFHYCFEPLKYDFGMEFYKDRIQAVRSAVVEPAVLPKKDHCRRLYAHNNTLIETKNIRKQSSIPSREFLYWSAFILADSALPVGSFAHSSGLEAASQLKLLSEQQDVAVFVKAATRSVLQMSSPLVTKSHELIRMGNQNRDDVQFRDSWLEIDQEAHALLVSNAPACRASLDQGRSLLRVADKWLNSLNGSPTSTKNILRILQEQVTKSPTCGHLSSVFGIVTALLNMTEDEACQLLGYCVARDIVSAAVRLNLVGPLASVAMLAAAEEAACQGTEDGARIGAGSGCSPILDALQPCHDILAVRLFRT